MIAEDETFEAVPALRIKLRSYQVRWKQKCAEDRAAGFSRLLLDGPGGTGKTNWMAGQAYDEWIERSGRTIILENRDRLVRQTAERVHAVTGLDVDIEMAEHRASPFAPIVVASVQSLGRVSRLTGFADNHFSLVIADEAHLSLAPQWVRVMFYLHYGAESLNEGWKKPEDGTYTPKATIVGTTATPDLGKKRSLGAIYQKFTDRYYYLSAVKDGWLVPPITESVPVKIGIKKLRTGRTANGSDYRPEDVSAMIIPIIEELAKQILLMAPLRKTMCFLPSVECARLMSEALCRLGMNASFVSGECLDIDEKTEAFQKAGSGSVLCNCAIYVAGVDFPDCDCVAWFRPTLSRAFYIQGVYRASRVLPGLVDDDMTAEQRCLAISLSKKPNMLILDPLFVSDRIDLCDFYDLFSDNPEVKKKIKAAGDISLEAVEKAERDFVKALEKAAKKNAHKSSRTINPISWALSIGDEKLASWQPENDREARPPSPGQIHLLRQFHIDVSRIKYHGLAHLVIGKILHRRSLNLASPGQLDMLRLLGVSDEQASLLSLAEAEAAIKAVKAGTAPTPQSLPTPVQAAPSIPFEIAEEVC